MQQHVSNGQVIVLNGTSSAGKSTLAKALQNLLPEPYLHLGIDTVMFALPKRYLNPPLWHEVFRYTWPPDGRPEGLAIDAGPVGHRLINGLHLSVAALARAGNHVIVDHVLLERAWVGECARLLGAGAPAGRRVGLGQGGRTRPARAAIGLEPITMWSSRVFQLQECDMLAQERHIRGFQCADSDYRG